MMLAFSCGLCYDNIAKRTGIRADASGRRQKGRQFALANYDKHRYPSVHRGIVSAALQALTLASHPAAGCFSEQDAAILIAEAAAPDQIGDRHQGRGLHYFNAVKPNGTPLPLHPAMGGYCNGKGAPAPSPLTVLDSEYRTALALRLAGKNDAAMRSLSRAMHMLADMCCPPHCCSLTYFSPYGMMHKRYESRAAELFWNCEPPVLSEASAAAEWAKKAAGQIPCYSGLLRGGVPVSGKMWEPGAFAKIGCALSESGADHLQAVLGKDDAERDRSITERLILSAANCAALLIAFDSDLRSGNPAYWLKNFSTAFVVSCDPLYLQFADDGTVSMHTQDGRYLIAGHFGRVSLTAQKDPQSCRFRFGREPLLTLYPDGDQNRLIALIRGQLYCIRRVSNLQGALFLSQVQFALVNQPPESARYLF